jgi:hypothetical protein
MTSLLAPVLIVIGFSDFPCGQIAFNYQQIEWLTTIYQDTIKIVKSAKTEVMMVDKYTVYDDPADFVSWGALSGDISAYISHTIDTAMRITKASNATALYVLCDWFVARLVHAWFKSNADKCHSITIPFTDDDLHWAKEWSEVNDSTSELSNFHLLDDFQFKIHASSTQTE